MARWAKSLNKQKDSFKNSFQESAASTEEDRNESAAADAGFSLFEKKVFRGHTTKPHVGLESYFIPETWF